MRVSKRHKRIVTHKTTLVRDTLYLSSYTNQIICSLSFKISVAREEKTLRNHVSAVLSFPKKLKMDDFFRLMEISKIFKSRE